MRQTQLDRDAKEKAEKTRLEKEKLAEPIELKPLVSEISMPPTPRPNTRMSISQQGANPRNPMQQGGQQRMNPSQLNMPQQPRTPGSSPSQQQQRPPPNPQQAQQQGSTTPRMDSRKSIA